MEKQFPNEREWILDILIEVDKNQGFVNQLVKQTLDKNQFIDKQKRNFVKRVAQGTVERQIYLDYVIEQFSKVKVRKMKPLIRAAIRMGAYQLLCMDGVPSSAACNESVALVKKRGMKGLSGFVNGVLRNIARNKDNISFPEEQKEPLQFLSIQYSMPQWIVTKWVALYGYEMTKTMLEAFLKEAPLSVRVNETKITKDELVAALKKQDINVENGAYCSNAIKISGYNYLGKIKEWKEGYFQVQDESSMLVCQIADIKPDNIIIDVCAAPGGKATHAAQLLNQTGMVYARDLTEKKVELMKENLTRLGLNNMQITCQDALVLDEEMLEKADVVIADLPCSGLGVIGKKSDIKYNMTEEKQKELVKLQRDILSVVCKYVKKGGTLIYSTCTINPEENEENFRWLLENKDVEFEAVDISSYLPKELQEETTKQGYLQLLPGKHSCDGFFMSRLRRKN